MVPEIGDPINHRGQLTRALIFGFSLALLLSSPAFCFQGETADEDYSFARGLYKTRRYEQAADAFKDFLNKHKDHPRTAVATLYYGLTLSNLGRYPEAHRQFDSFITNNPDNNNLPDATYRRAECNFYLKNYEQAEKELKAFRLSYPTHALVNWAYLFEGQSQLQARKWVEAEKTFGTLLKRKPELQAVHDAEYGLGRCLEEQNRISEAFNYYRNLVKANDKVVSPRALSRMGRLYFKAGDLEAAVKAYELIDKRYATNSLAASARLNVGLAYLRLNDYPKAIDWLKRANEDAANKPRANIFLAISLQKSGEYKDADTLLSELAQEFESNNRFAPEILYYRADGLRLSGRPEEAVPLFEKVQGDWPKSPFADDALYLAADAAVLDDQNDKAMELLHKLDTEYPQHEYNGQVHLLRGRILARGKTDVELKEAIAELVAVEESSGNPRHRILAKLYLARTYQRLKDHPSAIATAMPLVTQVMGGKHRDLGGVIVLAAVSQLAMGQFSEASKLASDYIREFPTGTKIVEAREAKAIAEAKQGNREVADAELRTLDKMSLPAATMGTAVRRVAEVAWERKMYDWSRELFAKLTIDRTSPLRPNGLSGLGWSHFEQRQFREAATAFGSLRTDYPEHDLAPEASFMECESLRMSNDLADAAVAYQRVFEKYLSAEAAPVGAELRTPTRFGFEAGRQLARLQEVQKDFAAADATYKRLTTVFPKAEKLDAIVERWAFMHLDSNDPNRADELFRFLIAERPRSPLVYNARLVLAESDMLAGRLADAQKAFLELKDANSAPDNVRQSALYNLVTISDRSEADADIQKYADEYLSRHPGGEFANHVKLFQAETLIRQQKTDEAKPILAGIRTDILKPNAENEMWHGRVWVVLGEIQLRDKEYDQARATAAEMLAKPDMSSYYYQMYDVVGRTYLNEASFDKARESFRKVTADGFGRGTATAGKCQLLLGETWLNQQQYAKALKEYQKAYLLYDGLPKIQAAGLFQAAGCEEKLKRSTNALKSYEELVEKFPNSSFAADAKQKIKKLQTANRP